MTGNEYKNIIKNTAFCPRTSDGKTHCDEYARNVMENCGVEFPQRQRCDWILEDLSTGTFSYWRECTSYSLAQWYANNGYPTVGVRNDHIVVVTPNGGNGVDSIGDVCVSQSGTECFFAKTLRYSWNSSSWPTVRFFYYCRKCNNNCTD